MLMRSVVLSSVGVVAAMRLAAQQPTVIPHDPICKGYATGEEAEYCEVREYQLSTVSGTLGIDASPNGGIEVHVWDKPGALVRAVVVAGARNAADARSLVSDVTVGVHGGRFATDGPDTRGDVHWSVSFVAYVPRQSDLDLASVNGAIAVEEAQGTIRARTTNGGLRFDGVGGTVSGRTTNGAIDVALTGTAWTGTGLDASTTNGGITIAVPEGYSARLETRTVNGGLDVGFPLTVQGRIGHSLDAVLGRGGPIIRATTTNGGVRVERPRS